MTVDASGKGFTLPSGPATLCFDKEDFMKKQFEVDKFIVECRKKVPLETLKDDLDLYLKVIRSAMIELINKDYADFVNLSTNLVGMDKAITNLTTPLGQLKEEVLSVQTAMEEAIQAVQEKIKQQQEIRRKKAVLQRLMNITHSVEKIEKLLGIQQGSEMVVSQGHLTGPLIERVATEFNKLQFYVTRSKGHPLVEKVKPRIAAITTTLQYSLEGSFLSGLESVNTGMLRQCLRTYALIDKTRDAEDLFRKHVVCSYMEQIISEDFLYHHNNDISAMFERVLAFIPDKCSVLNGITTGTSGDIVRGYDFIVNSVFPEVVRNLEMRISSIFAPGNPDIFHKKYTLFMRFLDSFEQSCTSQASVKRLRQHASYGSIVGKWNLPVYFQIRYQDIASSFESALCSGLSSPTGQPEFRLVASHALWLSLGHCWNDDIYLPALAHRFLRLNLQLLSRYKSWLDEVCEGEIAHKAESPSDSRQQSATPDGFGNPSSTGASGDHIQGSASPKLVSAQEAAVRPPVIMAQIVSVLSDLDKLSSMIPVLFESIIKPKLSTIGLENSESVQSALEEGMAAACECKPKFWAILTEDVIKKCSIFLTQVNDIPRLYRRTKKEVPTKPSSYLSGVVKPLTQFCEEHSVALTEQQRRAFLLHVFGALCQQFAEVTSEVLTSTNKMEESLRRLKKARGGEKEKERAGGVSDSDKIRSQLIIDIKNFLQQMEAMGLQPSQVDGHAKITALAHDAESDMTSS